MKNIRSSKLLSSIFGFMLFLFGFNTFVSARDDEGDPPIDPLLLGIGIAVGVAVFMILTITIRRKKRKKKREHRGHVTVLK
ncbi:MAG: hypothetical protein GF364_03090 [Candidatus Lokiarchaeota archaeon]|nr:hypothetical protein [Candidatus Lokiarchaeota archaeon]